MSQLLPNSFLYAGSFDSDYLPLGLNASTELYHIKFLDFNFKYIFGGERYLYFVSQDDELVQFEKFDTGGGANEKCKKTQRVILELSKIKLHGHNNGSFNDGGYNDGGELVFDKKVVLTACYYCHWKDCEGFVPSEYYRNSSAMFIVDSTRTRVLRIDGASQYEFKFERKIKRIITGPLANLFVVVDEANELWNASSATPATLFQKPDNNIIVKCGGAWNSGFMIFDQNNKMYVNENGSHVKMGLGFTNSVEFSHLPTFLEDKHTIEDVVGGFYHAIMVSREGKVFATGYDNMNQVTFGLSGNNSGENNLTECPIDFGEVTQIGGFSRGEYVINSKKELFCIAEMFDGFINKPNEQYPFVQKFNLTQLSHICNVGWLQFNDIANNGWQCCIFHNPNKVTIKHSQIREKLFLAASNSKLVDLTFWFDD